MNPARAVTAVALLLLTHAGLAPGGVAYGGVDWVDDYKEGLHIARREGRPLLLDFSTTWCPPCRKMEESFWPDPDVVELTRKFVCIKIDGDQARGLVARYRADAFPTILFLDPWGEEMARLIGYNHDNTLVLLDGLPGDFSSIVAAHARAEHDRKSLQPLLELGRFYGDHELYQISTDYYEKALKTREAKADPRIIADLMTAIGWNQIRIGEPRKARKTFERCLKNEGGLPGLDRTLYGLMSACLLLGDGEEAHHAYERLCSECPASELLERARVDLDAGSP